MSNKLLPLVLLFATQTMAQTVRPEVVASVSLSNTDANRVVCVNGDMNDVFFSTDKIQQVPLVGKHGFIKFPILKKGQAMQYVSKRAEFHFICDGLAYTLLASPEDVPAQVIYLGDSLDKRYQANVKLMGDMPIERQGIYLSMSALKDDLPANFRVTPTAKLVWDRQLIKDADIALVRTIKVDGIGLRLKEYLIKSYRNQYLDERRFVQKALSTSMLQVTVEPLSVKAGQMARVFIVEAATN
ncbi:MAG: conjugal transfer pilus assembly protein TraK [Alteromonadaceae bacterium]|jgi:conjugal transfer pilus assembly protein TraK